MQIQKAYQWIASLYFFQSMPFVVVSIIATIMYQQQGMDNANATLLTSLLLLPWAIKPLLAPYLERFSTKKRLTIFTQALVVFLFFILAVSVNTQYFLIISILGFACLAGISSIHDIVSDGVYLLNLDEDQQKRYVALRSFFYQMGRLVIKGGLLVVVGQVALYYKMDVWAVFFYCLFMIALVLTIYHGLKIPEVEKRIERNNKDYFSIFRTLIGSPGFYPTWLFIFLYNFTDAQMQKIIPLFLLDKEALNLSLSFVGEIYGIGGGLALMIGICISGFLITRYSIVSCIKNLTILMLLGHLSFLFLTGYELNQYFIYFTILFNQFAMGLVNGVYMGYLLVVANKSGYPMSMYTICIATMALSYIFFGALSGLIEQQLGYSHFFLYILVANSLLLMMTCRMMNKHV